MRHILRYSTLFLLSLTLGVSGSAQELRKKLDFVGGARSIVQSAGINTLDTLPDTTSLQSTLSGYALVDLGVAIRPNQETEIMGMFRIRNDFGGFWGADVSFDVRQLWLKGILGGVLKYQVGDINLKQTPFTLYNHHADRIDSLPSIFGIQNDIISYENFYTPENTWRQQGIALDFGLDFASGIKSVDFMGYVNRVRATDFANTPERIMPGGSVDFWIMDNFSLGYNISATTDLPGTARDSALEYRNTVQSIDLMYEHDFGDNKLSLQGELGASTARYIEPEEDKKLSGNFYYLNADFEVPKLKSTFSAAYLHVSPEFRSVGAQSKDINYAGTTSYYPTYTNMRIGRPLGLYDLVTNVDYYNRTVTSALMPFSPVYNNILPYGLATFNRTGFKLGYTYKNDYLRLDLQSYNLSEILGQGTHQLRQFSSNQFLAHLDIQELANMKRGFDFRAGIKLDQTKRQGVAGLGSIILDGFALHSSIDWEFFDDMELMIGYLMLDTRGNEFLTDRNQYTEPTYFTAQDFDIFQSFISGGLRYRFSPSIYIAGFYQMANYTQEAVDRPSYDTDNFNILFNMTF